MYDSRYFVTNLELLTIHFELLSKSIRFSLDGSIMPFRITTGNNFWRVVNLKHPVHTAGTSLLVFVLKRFSNPLAQEAKEYLLENFQVPYKDYDIVIGYRADDSYFSFAQDFINGAISVRQLGNAMKLGKPGTQIVLKSKKAFEAISFCGYETAEKSEWYSKKELRDSTARRQYFDSEKNKRQRGDLYIVQILDEEIKADDPRLR